MKNITIILALSLFLTGHLYSQNEINITVSPLPMKGRYVIDSLVTILKASSYSDGNIWLGKELAFEGWTLKLDTLMRLISDISVTRYDDGLFYNQTDGPFNENLHFKDLGYEGNNQYLYAYRLEFRWDEHAGTEVFEFLYFDENNIVFEYNWAYFRLRKLNH